MTSEATDARRVGSGDLMGACPYWYFVAYKHGCGFGRCSVYRQKPITDITDIEQIEAAIVADQKKQGTWSPEQKQLCVTNWQRFDAPIAQDERRASSPVRSIGLIGDTPARSNSAAASAAVRNTKGRS